MADTIWDVELFDVTKTFGDVEAVDHVTLKIERGKFYSLLGPSGCGKTTTLRMIAGFQDPTSGEIRIRGVNVVGQPPFKRPVNTVFQSYALFPHMTVAQNIAFGLEMKRVGTSEIQKRVSDALAMVRLPGTEKRYPKQLSGGQQQRVALARALVNRPQVLLLDEPLSALDRKLRQEMQLELKTLQREVGITFIYVTHDQEEALSMSDFIAVMNAGRVLQLDTPATVYERPTSRFVANFIGETNFLNGTVLHQAGARATVDCEGITVQADSSLSLKPNTPVTVAVRPENIVLTRECPPAEPNCFSVRITDLVYIGNDTRFLLRLLKERLPTPQTLRARQQNLYGGSPSIGYSDSSKEFFVYFAPESAQVLVA